jgi:hypothetical protein
MSTRVGHNRNVSYQAGQQAADITAQYSPTLDWVRLSLAGMTLMGMIGSTTGDDRDWDSRWPV